MMRENMGIYRGKRKDNGEWVYGFYVCLHDHKGNESHRIYTGYAETDCGDYYPEWFEVDPATVGQFTGLPDKNRERIFEGDVCRFREWSRGEMCWIGNIHYENQQFVISGGPNKECEAPFCLQLSRFVAGNIEVIGTFHDNPELLEVNKDE